MPDLSSELFFLIHPDEIHTVQNLAADPEEQSSFFQESSWTNYSQS
jgi:hypothetical protein